MSLKTTSMACGAAIGLAVCVGSVQAAIYVDDDAPLGGDGTTWVDAHTYLQDALAGSTFGDEIRVAGGTYKPDRDEAGNITPGDREATFQLVSGVRLYGGYAGLADPNNPDERDIELYETILSGDLLGNDGPDFASNDENSYHVVTGSGTDETAVLDGTSITGGHADGEDADWQHVGGGLFNSEGTPTLTECTFVANSAGEGGGIFNHASSPTLTDCTLTANTAQAGGGMYNFQDSSPTLTNCTISGNWVDGPGGGIYSFMGSHPTLIDCWITENQATNVGGGMFNMQASPVLTGCTFERNWAGHGAGVHNMVMANPTLTNCSFIDNSADYDAGGMRNDFSSPTLINCTFRGNSSGNIGGGMYNYESSPTLAGCTLTGNSAYRDGGGMFNQVNGNVTAENCIFQGNSAGYDGGALFNDHSAVTLTNCTFGGNSAENRGGGIYNYVACEVTLTDSILWGNSDIEGTTESSQIFLGKNLLVVDYTCIQGLTGAFGGTGNIGDDPLFVPGPGGCYYLSQTAAGQAVDSPGVDTGSDTAANLGLDTMTTRSDEGVDSGIADIGYHYPVTGGQLIMGDHDRDGNVDLADFAAFQRCFTDEGPANVSPCCRIFDFEPDEDVDLADYTAFYEAMQEGAAVCGNGIVEPGEECEPPNTPTCDANCQATGVCGPGSGHCGAANGTPGCDDTACCEAVCVEDSFCCGEDNGIWDEICVQGAIALCDVDVANDDCDSPTSVGDGTTSFDNYFAMTDGPDEPGDCTTLGSDVWFCYTTSCTTRFVTVSLCGSSYDTVMAIYRGCGCPMAGAIECSDDNCGFSLESRLTFQAKEGEQLTIRIGGYQNDRGEGMMTISCGDDPGFGACGPGAGDCLAEHGTPGCDDEICCNDVCTEDPYCCDVAWDDICAALGKGLCDWGFAACGPGAGDCSTPHDTPGCSDEDCCQAVCGVDVYCCIVEWDSWCVEWAGTTDECAP